MPSVNVVTRASYEVGFGHLVRCHAVVAALDRLGTVEASLVSLESEMLAGAQLPTALACLADSAVIVLDMNEMPLDMVVFIAELGRPIVNLASQGFAKEYATLSILPTPIGAPPSGVRVGFAYVPLRREFQLWHAGWMEIITPIRTVVVAMGGSDPMDFTGLALHALAGLSGYALRKCEAWPLTIRVILGREYAGLQEDWPRPTSGVKFEVYRDLDAREMAECLAGSDLAITAGGMTMFEACCVGTPSIVMPPTPFHSQVAAFCEAHCLVKGVRGSCGSSISPSDVREAILEIVTNKWRRAFMAHAGCMAIDGRGADRVAEIIYSFCH